jgi:hypothetical protein
MSPGEREREREGKGKRERERVWNSKKKCLKKEKR